MAAIATAAVVAILLFTGALGGGLAPVPSPTASPSAQPTPTAVPTPFSLEGLPRPVREVVEEWLDKCGQTEPPVDVSRMTKNEAEKYFDPLIEQCEESGD
ncbi:MAG: hypothetical protein ACRDGJ_11565 [Candidatus Limnocylindria bacterium]